ncbi:hypothetical protein MOQ_004986 [Trypanosoma cruzi marinkellei]|uniref:Uncharacterized protein n=1 Tax=Trypanosoma cruzi marinkellei TaxID=85056 RepID=K2N8T3_TRYCR|nr:hypothetical protein MOQ_004986 [Trypanosoma cruzi marinkellei]
MEMIHHFSRQGRVFQGSLASEERSASEERERIVQRLPASLQAMLLRAKLTLTDAEIQRISCATADQRCEALRMIFEGKSADESILFLLHESSRNTSPVSSAGLANPSTRAATMELAGTCHLVTCRSNSGKALNPSSSLPSTYSAHSSCEKEEATVQFPPPPSLRCTVMTNFHSAGDDEDGKEIFSLPGVSSQHSHLQPAPARVLREINANTAALSAPMDLVGKNMGQPHVKAKKSPSPDVVEYSPPVSGGILTGTVNKAAQESGWSNVSPMPMYPTSACSAWDDHFKTFIVHPNQLKRLEELERQMAPPAVVRPFKDGAFRRLISDEHRQFTRQNTKSVKTPPTSSSSGNHQKHTASSGKGGAPLTSRTHSTCYSSSNEHVSPTPYVPPLQIVRKKKAKEDVFTRLYSTNSLRGTPRVSTARERTCSLFSHGSITTARGDKLQRSSSDYIGRTPRQVGEVVNAHPKWWTTSWRRTSHDHCFHSTPVRVPSSGRHGRVLAESPVTRNRPPAPNSFFS